jgi:hexosaminidase
MRLNPVYVWLFSAMVITLLAQAPAAQAALPVIPKPVQTVENEGLFLLKEGALVEGNKGTERIAAQLASSLKLKSPPNGSRKIILVLDHLPGISEDGGYSVSVSPDEVRILAESETGLFYGVQTLHQLALASGFRSLPAVTIVDRPRFAWRGLLVDVARHFFAKEALMRVIDQMALYKLNVLHLHLTDDLGWRLPIPGYPKLTAGGQKYYSPGDIKALVAYAAARHIVIVPEIDMPGHSEAAAKVYPQLFDGVRSINPANPDSYRFVQAVFTEVARLFPSPYLHFGGDELRDDRWDGMADVVRMRDQLGLKSKLEVEGYFDRRVADIIKGLGRKPMAWDEAFSAGIGADVLIHWWRKFHPEVRDRAVKMGFDVVVSPADQVYLDYPQGPGEPGAPWEGNDNGPTSLAKILAWEPVPAEYSPEEASRVRGIEAALWTEFIRSESYLQFMLYPRLMAIAEVAWSTKGDRDLREFESRLEPHFNWLRAKGIRARRKPEDAAAYITH